MTTPYNHLMPKVLTQPHIAATALIEKEGRFLLVRENKPGHPDHGKWNHPAGWVELGEELVEGVIRETKEETGGDFAPKSILGLYTLVRLDTPKAEGGYPHGLKVVFLGEFTEASGTSLAGDVSGTRWFTPQEIESMDQRTLRDADIKGMIGDYLTGTSFPLSILHHCVVQ